MAAPLVGQCGARLGEDAGREDGDTGPPLALPLAEDDVGGPQVRAGLEVNAFSLSTLSSTRVRFLQIGICFLPFRWEMLSMKATRSVLSLLSYLGLFSMDAEMYEYLR